MDAPKMSISKGGFRGGFETKNCEGILIVFDLSNSESFKDLENWIKQIERYSESAQLIIVGNCCDKQRNTSQEAAQQFAESIGLKYIETSAKTGNNVQKCFVTLIDSVLENPTAL